MQMTFRLSAISLAVLATLGLTACSSSNENPLYQRGKTTSTVTSGSNSSTTTTEDTTQSGDSDQFTTFTRGLTSAVDVTEVPKNYYAGGTASSLLTDLSKEYGATKADGTAKFEAIEGYRATITSPNGDIALRSLSTLSLSDLGNDYQQQTLTETAVANIDGVQYTGNRTSRVRLYQQDNSVVLGRQTLSGELSNGTSTKTLSEGTLRIDQLKGTPTSEEDINELIDIGKNSKFTYSGQAFSQEGTGTLTYSVDFYDQSGSGTITGLADKGTINLNQGNFGAIKHVNPDGEVYNVNTKEKVGNELTAIGIQGVANFANGSADGTYTLGFFGSGAAEIAGFVTEDNVNTVGFGGKKQ